MKSQVLSTKRKKVVVNPAVGIVSFVGDGLRTILQENRKKFRLVMITKVIKSANNVCKS